MLRRKLSLVLHQRYFIAQPNFIQVYEKSIDGSFALPVMLFRAFSALHIVLFLYYKRERANFYYGLFAIGFSAIFFISYIEDSGTNILMTSIFDAITKGLIVPFCILTIIRLLSQIFNKKSTIAFYSMLTLAILYNPMSWFDVFLNDEIYIIMLVIGVAEIIRQIILAMVEKKEGSRIFAFGLLFLGYWQPPFFRGSYRAGAFKNPLL